MNEPTPAEGFPDDPLSEETAAELLQRPTAQAVWVMDHDRTTVTALVGPDAPADVVIELVVETDEAFEMYSYTHHAGQPTWVSYGSQPKGSGFETTLESYRLLAGETGVATTADDSGRDDRASSD